METLGDKIASKNEQNEDLNFSCNICNYICSKKYNFNRHLLSSKHATCSHDNQKVAKSSHDCDICNKKFNG